MGSRWKGLAQWALGAACLPSLGVALQDLRAASLPGPFPPGGLDFLLPGVLKWPRRGRGGWQRSVADWASAPPRHSSRRPPTSSPPGLQPPEDQPHSWNRSPSPPGRLIPRGQAEAFTPPLPPPPPPGCLRPAPLLGRLLPPTRRAPPAFRTAEGGLQKQGASAKAGDCYSH